MKTKKYLLQILTLIPLLTVCCVNAKKQPTKPKKQELADKSELYTGKEYKNAYTNPKDNPDLPNILIIGDSISIGYTVEVRKLLKGKADVFRIKTNGRYSAYGLKKLDQWLGKRKWDIIHFNWGLWDICYRDPKSNNQGKRDKIHGKLTTTPEQYQKNLEKIVKKLKKTNAKLIWCETTPVPPDEVGRKEKDEIKYNQIANKIMEKNNITINKLHAYALKKLPEIKLAKGNVHFTKKGYKYLAKKVATQIETTLKTPKNQPKPTNK